MNKQKYQGSMMGTFVGDALGMPVEGLSNSAILARYGGPLREMEDCPSRGMGAGTYTDDTQLMIGIAEALVDEGGLDCAAIARRFVENFDVGRGYGPGTIRVIHSIAGGERWDLPARGLFGGEGSFGNGSSMRISPIGCISYDTPETIRRLAEECSRITHAHPLGMEGGVVQAWAVALAVATDPGGDLDPVAFVNALVEATDKERFSRSLIKVRELLKRSEEPGVPEVVRTLGNDVRTFRSVPTAIYSFLSHPDSFEEAVVYGVNLGGDTDTIGAMTGAMAGGYHGVEAIPGRWLDVLENGEKGRDYVLDLADRLWQRKQEGAFGSP